MFGKFEDISDIYTGLIFLLTGVFLFMNISSLQVKTYDHLGSKLFPQFICASIGILGATLMLKAILPIKKKANTTKSETDEESHLIFNEGFFPSLLFVLATTAYFLSLQKGFGFVLSTSVYLFIEMMILNRREKSNLLILGLFAVSASLIIYWVFEKFLMLMLP